MADRVRWRARSLARRVPGLSIRCCRSSIKTSPVGVSHRFNSPHIYQQCGLWKARNWWERVEHAARPGPTRSKLANRMATKILLAEDDTDMRRFLVKALQTAGYN